MSCDQCHEREAVINLTQIVSGQITELHLCERCAAERGVEGAGLPAKSPLGDFLAAMGKSAAGDEIALSPGSLCPSCGGSLKDFRDTGRLGCADCYRSFETELRDLLRRLHGSTHHMGERYTPPGVEPLSDQRVQQELRDRLRLAIETENFELAAEIRDRLRVLE